MRTASLFRALSNQMVNARVELDCCHRVVTGRKKTHILLAPNGRGVRRVAPNPSFLEYQPACKPGFVGYRLLAQTIRDGHSSGTTFARCLEQPTRTASLTSPCGVIACANGPALPSLFGFAPGVVCHAVSVAGPAVRSYRTFSPLPRRCPKAKAGGSFSVALSLGLPPPEVIRHRMSMEPGLSSPAAFRP